MQDLRDLIIGEFLGSGRVPSPQSIARKAGIDLDTFRRKLENTPRLSNLKGLTPEQARQLIETFGKGVLFEADIESSLERLAAVRKEIEDKEKRHK